MEVDQIDTCKEMVLTGMGYAILPGISLKSDDPLHKIKITTRNQKPLVRNTRLLVRNKSLKLSMVRAFVEQLRNFQHRRNDE